MLSFVLAVVLLSGAGSHTSFGQVDITFGRSLLIVFGLIALAVAAAKIAAGIGAVRRRPNLVVLGIVMMCQDAFFTQSG